MDFFRRGNSKLVNKDDKTNKNTSNDSPTGGNDKNHKMADSKPAYSRDRNSDRGPRVKDVVEQFNTTRVSPQGPRGIPNSKSGEREPYQTKHFGRSDSVPSITAITPVKGPRGPDNSYGRRDRSNTADRANYDSSDSFYSPTPKNNRHSTPPGYARPERRPMLPDSPLKRQIRVVSRTASDDLRSDALMARPPPPAKLVKAQSQRDDRKHKPQMTNKQPIKSSSNNDGSMAPPKPPFIPPGKPANRVISAEMQTWLVQSENVLRKFGSPEKPKLRSKFESLEPKLDKKEKEAFDNFKAMTQQRAALVELKAQEIEAQKKRDSADSTKSKRDGIIFDADMVMNHMSNEARKSQGESNNGGLGAQLKSYGDTQASIFSEGSIYSQEQNPTQNQSRHSGLYPDSNRNTQASIRSADSKHSQDDARRGGLNSGASSTRNTQESFKAGDSRYPQDQNKPASNDHLFYDDKRSTEKSAKPHDTMLSNDPAKRSGLGSRSQSEKNRQFSGNSNETGYDGDRESHLNVVYRSESNKSSRPGYNSTRTTGNRDFSKLSSELIQKNKPSIYNETIGKYDGSTLPDAASIKSMSPGKERRAMRKDALSRAHIRKPLPELKDLDRPKSPYMLSIDGSESGEARLDQLTRIASSMILNPAPGKEGPARRSTRWGMFNYPPPDEEPPYVRHTPRMNFEEYHDGYTLKPKVYGLPDSAEMRREADMKQKSLISPKSRIPTPIKSPGSATKRKPVASGLTMGDLGMKMAKEYQKIGDPLYMDTSRSGLPRSFGDVNIAGKLLENPTWEELNSQPMKYTALIPRELTIRKKSSKASIKSNESSIRKVSAESQRLPMDMLPPLRPTRTQPNRSASAQQRDWETYYNDNNMMTEMHNEIDEYLACLLEEKRDRRAQLIKEEAKRAEAAEAAEAGEVAGAEETGTWQKIKTAMRFSNESSPKRASTQSQRSQGRGEMLVDDLIKRLK